MYYMGGLFVAPLKPGAIAGAAECEFRRFERDRLDERMEFRFMRLPCRLRLRGPSPSPSLKSSTSSKGSKARSSGFVIYLLICFEIFII